MRKLFLLAALAVMMGSCKLPQMMPHEPYTKAGVIDYTVLTEAGYFVTESNTVPFEYQSIGSAIIEAHGGWVQKTKEKKNQKAKKSEKDPHDEDYYYRAQSQTSVNMSNYTYIAPAAQSALEDLQALMDAKGADGILNLEMKFITKPGATAVTTDEYIQITGMLFKRK